VDCYPNISIAYRILCTMHVIVASAQRSFSKLKLLNNYLRSTMTQQRLNGLATSIDIDPIISDFASRNVTRKNKGNMYKLLHMLPCLDAFKCY
jgi:hypothetical protein